MTISLLINSWRRPENVMEILDTQSQYDLVGEIIVFNNYKKFSLRHDSPKAKIINSAHDFGLRTRWANMYLARNECVIFQDDDLILEEDGIEKFYKSHNQDSGRGYSAWGRNPDDDGNYNMGDARGEIEIMLTRACCVNRRILPYLIQSEIKFLSQKDFEYVNGEDIFLSYCLTSFYGKLNRRLSIPYKKLSSDHAISDRSGHSQQRTKMVRRCKAFFEARHDEILGGLAETRSGG
jgi:hypothetical protein